MARRVNVCTIPGDGVGPEVIDSACDVLRAVSGVCGTLEFDFDEHPAGHRAFEVLGQSIPEDTVSAAIAADAVLVGAMDVARLPHDQPQPLRRLRRELSVAASVRPARSFGGENDTSKGDVDLLTVREVTEGFYSGIEYSAGKDAACAVRVITRDASLRAARIAFDAALERRGKVTAVHKIGAMKLTDTLFLSAVEEAHHEFPSVELETRNVDACAMELVTSPSAFDVILATNAFGDILSDIAAGLVGGVGVAPSACVGKDKAYFEPVHGSAPDIAGQGVANPIGAVLSAALMLHHLDEHQAAAMIERSVAHVLMSGAVNPRDPGSTTTRNATDDIIGALSV